MYRMTVNFYGATINSDSSISRQLQLSGAAIFPSWEVPSERPDRRAKNFSAPGAAAPVESALLAADRQIDQPFWAEPCLANAAPKPPIGAPAQVSLMRVNRHAAAVPRLGGRMQSS
jgi:hypothetical protein